MKFSEALEAIKKLENGSELASAIESEVEGLKSKNYEVIGEKRNATTKAQSLETTVMAIAKSLGIEGDLDAILSSAEGKVKELASSNANAQTKLNEAEARATTAETKLKTSERSLHLQAAATKAGANLEAFKSLVGDMPMERIKVADDGVKLMAEDGKTETAIADYAKEKAGWLVPALFPTQKQLPKLPSGPPTSGNPKEERAAKSYMDSIYGKTADQLIGSKPNT